MSLVLLLVVLAVIGGIAVVAAGRGGSLGEPDPDRATTGSLPDDEVDRSHVDGLRFTLALRGYRMDEVDAVLDKLVDELDRRGERIRALEVQGGAGGTTVAEPAADEPAADEPAADEPAGVDGVAEADPAGPTTPRDA
ncbi:MAG TPA: DivIVA domain-containing protein [Actinomycetes bacterium]|nr:DivIVA domain-containing protein [Actinomycetes bacterium]